MAQHPGRLLFDQFLRPTGLSCRQVARDIGVPVTRITNIVAGKNGVSALTAMMLAERFGTTVDFWMDAQKAYDKAMAGPMWEAFKEHRTKRRRHLGR